MNPLVSPIFNCDITTVKEIARNDKEWLMRNTYNDEYLIELAKKKEYLVLK